MATLQQRRNLIGNVNLHDKVRIAAYDVATAVLADPARADEHPFFQNVVQNPDTWNIQPLIWEIVQNPAIQEKTINNPRLYLEPEVDADIIYVVTNAITKYSVPASPSE